MSLLILYGTETGTAEDVAESVWRESRAIRLSARLLPFDEYDIEALPCETAVVFVMATSGQGEFPPCARTNWKWLLRRSLPRDLLHKVRIAVIGLGDSSYQKYNFAGKKLFRRLLQLGAQELLPICLADDQHESGIDGALLPWKDRLWPELSTVFEEMSLTVDPNEALLSKFELDYGSCENGTVVEDTVGDRYGDLIPVTVLSNERVTADSHFQDTRLITFDARGIERLSYSPGDVLMVQPCNPPESVSIALEALQYTDAVLDAPFRARPTDPHVRPLPVDVIGASTTTLRECLHRLFDLQQRPRRSFFELLGAIAEDEMEREKLLELASAAGQDDYIDYITRTRRTVAETLRDFGKSAASIPPHRLFDILPRIRPRAFSIASCPRTHGGLVQILVARVEYRTARMAEPRRGLCSTFLARLREGDTVLVRVRAGTFRFPDASRPVVAVGPGTGVAPFRSLFWSRLRDESSSAASMLFFGCRGRDRDDYFRAEWADMDSRTDHRITVHTAYSRDDADEEGKRRYVQHVMLEKRAELARILADENAMMFIAGSSGDMPKAVAEAIDLIAKNERGLDNYSATLEREGRLQFETWD